MPASQLEVIHDAIKIGFPVAGTILGATIGAIGTYFVTRLKYSNEVKKEVLVRRMSLVEEIAEDYACFSDIIAKHWAESKLEHEQRIENKQASELVQNNLESIAQLLHDAQPKLKRIESRLLVLGIEGAYDALLKYVAEVERFRISVGITVEPMHDSGFEKYSKSLGDMEIEFYKQLRSGYTNA